MAKRVKDLAVVTGSYFKDGLEKRRYAKVGVVMEGDDGNQFMMINRHINFAGLPFKEGSESVVVSIFDPRDDNAPRQQAPQQQTGGGQQFADELDGDEIPFIRPETGFTVRRVI